MTGFVGAAAVAADPEAIGARAFDYHGVTLGTGPGAEEGEGVFAGLVGAFGRGSEGSWGGLR